MAYNKGFHGGNHRTKPYGFMLVLVFGAALLGAMILHKLKERHVFNLCVGEKDHELLSLQILLQKERDRVKEIEGKNEEMKAKIYALRGQKMELNRRVLKMESTMNSLKEEQRLMESAFEEKQNEIIMLQGQKNNMRKGGSEEVIALKENLMQNEAEIKKLNNEHGRMVSEKERKTDAEQGKKNEDPQVDDSDSRVTAKSENGKENKTIREEKLGLANDAGQQKYSNVS